MAVLTSYSPLATSFPNCSRFQVPCEGSRLTLAASGQTVIYVVAEGLQGYRGRKRTWQQFRKQSGGNLFLWRQSVRLFEPSAVRLFIDAIRPKQPTLVVFDTLSRCSLGADENNQKDMGFILEALDTVRRGTGATVVAVHHTNAAGLRERGSTVIRGGMDVMLEVSKDDDLIVVSCSKMKDAVDFEAIYLKPVLVDIGEELPVPVLIPAEKRTQTQADKLTPLQLEILRAVGMEMFAESGIKSNQLDELLPPTTERASKYHSLNTLIRLGYVKPHVKGDPYHITDEGRLKLPNTENGIAAGKSNKSKASPTLFIWTLPDPSLMSSPIPHTGRCGMDETLDTTSQTGTPEEKANREFHKSSDVDDESIRPETVNVIETARAIMSTLADLPMPRSEIIEELSDVATSDVMAMPEAEIAAYAAQIGVPYPTASGPELYQIAGLIPKARREAFELGLGNDIRTYYDEVARRGKEPDEQPAKGVLDLHLSPG